MIASAHEDTFARDNLPARDRWPDLTFELSGLRYPARMNATVELLDRAVDEGHGARVALRTDAANCSYAQLRAQVDRIAHVLRDDLGLVPGNRVLLRAANHPMMAACWLAVIKAGLVAVATMPLLRARELAVVVEKARIDAALCDARLPDELATAWPAGRSRTLMFNDDAAPADVRSGQPGSAQSVAARPRSLDALCRQADERFVACDTASDDVALIAFTSGTTGQPKGTMHFHRDVMAMCDLFPRSVLKAVPDDIFCGTPPLAFTFGLGGMLCFPLRARASVVLAERLTPKTLLETIARHRATICFTAPTFYRQMAGLAGGFDIGSLTKCVSAGEALPDATRTLWRETTGIEMIDGIGATEMIHIFISSPPEEVRPGAIGRVVPGYEARIVDERMNPLAPGEPGLLAVRGPTGCRYLADDRQSVYVRDGWNLPGDTFSRDADGYFHYVARADDMIVSAGYNIAGPEVEDALLEHDAIAECAVIGAPDPARGQIVQAFVVLKPGRVETAELVRELQDHVKATIAPYKYPRDIRFVDSLPRTETGKLQRFRLRE